MYSCLRKVTDYRHKLQSALAETTSDPLPTSLVELRTSFRRRLVKFRQLQGRYQPEATTLIAQQPATAMDIEGIQNVQLFLPSSLPPELRAVCSQRLVSMETELRIGQCHDSLVQLRTKLIAQARLYKHKYVNVRHQGPNTRSRNMLSRIDSKIKDFSAKYRRAFEALATLDPDGSFGWQSDLLKLGQWDARRLNEPELPDAPTHARALELQSRTLLNGDAVPEGHRTISWIWRGSIKDNSASSDPQNEFNEG